MRETNLFKASKFKQLKSAAQQAIKGHSVEYEQLITNQHEQEIFNLQKEKQLIMQQLKEELKKIDQGVGKIMGSGEINRDVQYNFQKNIFYIDNHGQLNVATLGQLITDASYGIEYNLSVEQLPRQILKQYAVAKAKVKLRRLFDFQLLQQAELQAKQQHQHQRAEIFKKVINQQTTPEYQKIFERSAGLIFEKNIVNLLKQLEYDLPQLNIKVEEVDIIKDMDEKIDFIITIKNIPHRRAVNVEEENVQQTVQGNKKTFGIQFTINPYALEHKARQIEKIKQQGVVDKEKIDDLLLIRVPVGSREIVNNYKAWQQKDQPSGGPEKLFNAQTKINFLKEIFKNIGQANIIEQHLDKLHNYYHNQ